MGGSVSVRLNLNASGYSAEMVKAQRTMQGFASATRQMGHGTVSQMQAASAAIRVLEGGMTGNIRAAERFISTIPGVGKALQAAFPIVGGIALAGVFVKIAEEATKAILKVEQASQAITNSFRTMNTSGQSANDTLAVTNDRLENEIAKLQGKPQNNLALAIDEARLAADKMAESLDRDNLKIKELLSQNAVPWWAGFLGKAGTSDVAKNVNAQNQHLSDLAAQMNIAQHQGDTGEADRLRVAIDAMRSQYLQANADEIRNRQANQNLPGGLNQGANISILQGQQSSLFNQFDQENELARNTADEAEKAKLEGAKAMAEAQKQAQELIVQQWRKGFDEAKADNDMTVAQEAQYWVQRMESARKGSLSYLAALDETNKLIAQMRTQNMRGQKEFDQTSAASYLPGNSDLSKGDTSQEEKQGRESAAYITSLNEQIAAQRAAANSVAEQSLEMAVATGQMSRLDAAQVRATMHAQEFARAQQELAIALANAAQVPGVAGRTMVAGLTAQGAQMQAQQQIQSTQDQQAIAAQQIGPAITQELGRMANDWTNMTKEIVQIMEKAADSFNNDIVKAMLGKGKASDFGKTFSQAGEGLLKTGLKGVEGMALKAFGLGGAAKPDGSSSKPFYVVMGGAGAAGSAAGTAAGIAGALPSGIMHSVGAWLSGIFQGGHASGGDVLANRPALVGEQGPEMFVPKTAGTIIPNGAMGGSGDLHIHVDARGSNDPAAIEAAVRRASPGIVAASMQAQHSNSKRNPGR